MNLTAIINDTSYKIEVPQQMLIEAQDFFAKMDQDMDQGWQMSRSWIDNPNKLQRCQIAANKLLTALETENSKLALMMAGYILHRLPGVTEVEIDTSGEMMNTQFTVTGSQEKEPAPVIDMQTRRAEVEKQAIKTKMDAIEQAGKDVTKVYKVGRAYRFATYDHDSNRWLEAPFTKTQEEANELRQQAYEKRLAELLKSVE